MPSTSGTTYRCNQKFSNLTDNMVEEIATYCSEQDLIQLTIHNGYLYYQ